MEVQQVSQVSEVVRARIDAQAEREAERHVFVQAMTLLFVDGKISAVHLGDRMSKWELVECLRLVRERGAT